MSATVELDGVSKSFRGRAGDVDALAATDLRVEAGEFVSVVGPSGCGKTTLLRLIAGLDRPTTGSIRVDGHGPGRAREDKRIGFVPQSPALLPWRTVRANARLLLDVNSKAGAPAPAADGSRPARSGPSRVDELLDEVGLTDFADAHPHELSGGMRQRVGLVRAFALDAPLLLMDEPFAALDELGRADMRHLLARLRGTKGSTVVFVTHSVSEAVALSDRVVVLSQRPGSITADHLVDLARPRTAATEETPEFFAATVEVRRSLSENVR